MIGEIPEEIPRDFLPAISYEIAGEILEKIPGRISDGTGQGLSRKSLWEIL